MRQHLESLEHRTLFTVTLPTSFVAADNQINADAAALHADFLAAVAQDKADLNSIKADLKTQPKTLVGSHALAKLNVTDAVAKAKESADLAKFIAITKADMIRVRTAFLLDLKKPTALDAMHLNKTLLALEDIEDPDFKFTDALNTGGANIQTALIALVNDYPSDTNLQSLFSADDTDLANAYNALTNACSTVINDEANVLTQVGE